MNKGSISGIRKSVGLAVFLIPFLSHGQVKIPSYTPPGHEGSASLGRGASQTIRIEQELTPVVGVTSPPCNKGEYTGKDLSWNFLHSVSSGRISYDDDVSLNEKGELEGNFYLDYYISACFIPAIKTVKREGKSGNGIFVRVENIYFDGKGEYDNIDNIDKKYEQCLKNEGLLNADGGIDVEEIEEKGLISSVALPYRNAEENGEPLKLDKNRTYEIYFASNKASDYGTPASESVADRPTGENWKCSNFHRLSGENPFYKGELDLLAEDIIDICEGNSFENKIREVLRLRNSSSVSNFKELSGAVDDILIQALEKEQEEIFEGEGKLEDIESRMRELLVESRKRDKRIDNEALGEEARNLGKEYKTLLVRLQEKIHRPAKGMIERLYEDYENAKSDMERESIKDRLNEFSQIIGRFSDRRKDASCRRGPCAFYKQFYIYEGQEQFARESSRFENLRLSSAFWSRSSKDGRGALSPSTIRRKVKVGNRKFAKKINAWGRDASVLEGDKSPIRFQQKRIGRSMERAQKVYEEGPYKGLSWWCKSANTQACAKKRRQRERNFQRRMQRFGQSIQRDQSRLMHYEGLAEQYQLRREYEMEQYGFNEDGYFDDEDYYLDQYHFPGFEQGGYQGPYAPSNYDMYPPGGSPYNLGPPPPMGPGW